MNAEQQIIHFFASSPDHDSYDLGTALDELRSIDNDLEFEIKSINS